MFFFRSVCWCCIVCYALCYNTSGIPRYDSMSKHLPLCQENTVNTGQGLCRCTRDGQLEVYLIRPGQSCIRGHFSLSLPDSGAFTGCDSNFAPTNGNDGDCTALGIGESCQPGCDPDYISVGMTTCVGNNEYSSITTCSQCSSPKTIINNECVCPEGFDGTGCNYCAVGFAQGGFILNEYCWKCDMNDAKKCNTNGCVATTSSLYTYQPLKNSKFCNRCKTCSSGRIPEGCGGISEGTGICIEKDECNPNPCDASAICIEQSPGFKCECKAGFAGDGHTCQVCSYPLYQELQNQTSCNTCSNCSQGLAISGCGDTSIGTCVDIDACTDNECSTTSTCVDTPAPGTGYTCYCEPGWLGERCNEDLKECLGDHGCDTNAICVDDTPGFHCECNPGYGDTSIGTCVDIDACTDNECSTTSTCVDTPAPGTGYTCDCEPGWLGERCNEDLKECLVDHGCDTNAICVVDTQGFHCECNPGYVGDNNTCIPCNSGKYQDVGNQTECKFCPGGTGGTTGVSGAYQSCSDCGSGYGKKNGNCVLCQASSYQWDNSVDESQCNTHSKCPIGYGYKHVNENNACSACNSTSEFNDIDLWSPCFTKKTSCPDDQLLIQNPSINTHDDNCTNCTPGYQCDGSAVKIQCQKGYFSKNAQCKPCPKGTYSLDGANICIDCGDDSKYSDTNSSSCTDCPSGSFTSGGTEQTRETCQPCPSGHYCVGTSVTPACTGNNYTVGNQSVCLECPVGFWPDLSHSNCDWCDLDWGKKDSVCEKCQDSYFSYTQSANPCVYFTCPKGQGVHSSEKCRDCVSPAFSDSNHTGTCEMIACPKGTFFKWTNTSTRPECLSCPENTFLDESVHHNQNCKPYTECDLGYGSGIATAEQDRTCTLCQLDVTFSLNKTCVPVSEVICGKNQYYVPGTSTADRHCMSCPKYTFKSKLQHNDTVCDFTYLKILATGSSGSSSVLKNLFTNATSSDVQVTLVNGTYTIEISKPLSNGNQYPDVSQERETVIGLTFSGVEFDLSQSPCINKAPQDGSFGQCPRILEANETCQPSCKTGFTLYRGPVCAQAVLKEPICISNFETDLLDGILTEDELIAVKEQNTNKDRFIAIINNKTLDVQKRRRVFRFIFDYQNTPFDVTISQAHLHPNIQASMIKRNIDKIKIIPPKYKASLNCSNADIDISNAPRAFEIPLQYEHETALICRKNAPITKMRLKSNKYMVSCFENNQWGTEFSKNYGDTYQCGTLEFFVNSLGSTTCNVKFVSFGPQSLGNCPQTLVEGESCELGCNYFYQFVTGPSTCTNGVYSGAKCLASCHKIQHDWDHHCCGPRGHLCRALKATFKQYGCCSLFIGTPQHSRY